MAKSWALLDTSASYLFQIQLLSLVLKYGPNLLFFGLESISLLSSSLGMLYHHHQYYVWQNVNHFVFFWDLIHPPYIVRKNSLLSPLLKLSSQYYVWIFPLCFAFTFECCFLFKTSLLFWLVYSSCEKCWLVIMWVFTAEYSLFHPLPCYLISKLHKIFATVLLFLEAYWFLATSLWQLLLNIHSLLNRKLQYSS